MYGPAAEGHDTKTIIDRSLLEGVSKRETAQERVATATTVG